MSIIHQPRFTAALAGAMLISLSATAADNLGAHQHGHAELQIAMDSDQVDVFLRSPAYNLLGFEHEPRTAQQLQQVEELKKWARSTPLVNLANNNCTVTDSNFHSAMGKDTPAHHDDHDDHSHHGHEHESDENTHSDIEITQSLTCTGMSGAQALTTPLMSRFDALEQVNVQWVGAGGQGSTRLKAGQRKIRITP